MLFYREVHGALTLSSSSPSYYISRVLLVSGGYFWHRKKSLLSCEATLPIRRQCMLGITIISSLVFILVMIFAATFILSQVLAPFGPQVASLIVSIIIAAIIVGSTRWIHKRLEISHR